MQDDFELLKQQPGFPELASQAWDLAGKALDRAKEARAEFEAAAKALHRAEEALRTCDSSLEKMFEIGERLGYPRELVEAYCRHEATKAKERAGPEGSNKRRLPNTELMILVAELIAEKGRPTTLEEILETLDGMDILLPGKAPEKNMLAYLSRSPLIRSVKRGWYDYDPALLDAAKRQVKGAQSHE